MQKMQTAAGGKGRGAGGMPTPAQIQAMQACIQSVCNFVAHTNIWFTAFDAAWNVAANAAANEKWRRHAGDDESDDARPRRRSDGYGRDATCVTFLDAFLHSCPYRIIETQG
jgi:hypothetical protein